MGSIPILPRRLDQLPDEILIQILENLSAQRDLAATCLVNRRMNHVADPVLYKSILFCEPKHHFTFSESLVKRPRRGSVIQDIRLHYPSSELSDFIFAKQSRIDGFSDTISTMSNLESLEIHVPESLCHGIGTLFNGPFDLACLKICMSHLISRDSIFVRHTNSYQAHYSTSAKMAGIGTSETTSIFFATPPSKHSPSHARDSMKKVSKVSSNLPRQR
jgi:hypothetical protein